MKQPTICTRCQRNLRSALAGSGWKSRRELVFILNWPLRRIRRVAESLGPEIVRGQKGFKRTDCLTSKEKADALEAARAARNQARRMARYARELEKAIK